ASFKRSYSPSSVFRRRWRCLASQRQPGSMTERNNRMAPSFHSGAGFGPCASRRRQVLVNAAEALPVVVGVAAQLADPGGAQAEPAAYLECSFPPHQVLGQAAVTLRARRQPTREVDAKADLLGDGGGSVVAQRLRQRVAAQRAEVGQALNDEMLLS